MIADVTSTLELVEVTHRGEDVARLARRPGDTFLEFVIDGQSLGDMLQSVLRSSNEPAGYVSVLVLNWPIGFLAEEFGALIGEPSTMPGGRVPFYICAECGDLGCGAVTAVVEWTSDAVVWRDFGYQNDYEPFDTSQVVPGIGPFVFDRQDYLDVLAGFRDRWPVQSPVTGSGSKSRRWWRSLRRR